VNDGGTGFKLDRGYGMFGYLTSVRVVYECQKQDGRRRMLSSHATVSLAWVARKDSCLMRSV
jgi:hypothetical protein